MNFKIQRCQNNFSNKASYSRTLLEKRRISLSKMNQAVFLFSKRAQNQANMPSANTIMNCWEPVSVLRSRDTKQIKMQ